MDSKERESTDYGVKSNQTAAKQKRQRRGEGRPKHVLNVRSFLSVRHIILPSPRRVEWALYWEINWGSGRIVSGKRQKANWTLLGRQPVEGKHKRWNQDGGDEWEHSLPSTKLRRKKKDGRLTKSKSKLQKSHQKISFAVIWMTTESQLRMRSPEGGCGSLFSPPTYLQKRSSLDGKPLKGTPKSCDRDPEG